MINRIAAIKIDAQGKALIEADQLPRDREIIIRALGQLLDWLKTHTEGNP